MKTRGATIYESDDGLRQAFVVRDLCKAKGLSAARARLLAQHGLSPPEGRKRGWSVLLFEMTTPYDRDTGRIRHVSLGKGEFCSCTACRDHADAKWTPNGLGRVSLTYGEARALARAEIEGYEAL